MGQKTSLFKALASVISAGIFSLHLGGCAGPEAEGRPRVADQAGLRNALARTAGALVGTKQIEVQGRRFSYDCSGLARAVYYAQGIDLDEGAKAQGVENGVRLIYRFVVRHGRIHHGPTVSPGDLVFFHNSWDANGDGRLNDLLTHVGVVERVGQDGTVIFISRVSGGVERFRMNLKEPTTHKNPKGQVLNDFMRKKRARDPRHTEYLTAQLFAAFGTLASFP